MLFTRIVTAVLFCIGASSCTEVRHQTKITEREGVSVIEMAPDVKVAFIKAHDTQLMYCAPRQGDIADTSRSGFGIDMSSTNQDDIGDESAQGALLLGGRSPEVILSRELMFRACELTSNINANKQEAIEIYLRFLKTLQVLSIIETKGVGTNSQYQDITHSE